MAATLGPRSWVVRLPSLGQFLRSLGRRLLSYLVPKKAFYLRLFTLRGASPYSYTKYFHPA